jgi:ATP/maltotriose-dependent transcriptional regulator MalT
MRSGSRVDKGDAPPIFVRRQLPWNEYGPVRTVRARHFRGLLFLVRKARLLRMLELRFNMTPREIEVIELLCNGASNAAIATVLDIKLATVKTHVLNIFEKLGVESRAAVAAYCQAP